MDEQTVESKIKIEIKTSPFAAAGRVLSELDRRNPKEESGAQKKQRLRQVSPAQPSGKVPRGRRAQPGVVNADVVLVPLPADLVIDQVDYDVDARTLGIPADLLRGE